MADIPSLGMKPILIIDGAYTQKIFFDASDNEEYICLAKPGSATSAAVWQIRKLAYSATGKVNSITWAGGNDLFDKVADDRASLSYS